jgi:hypothetical protein
MTDRAASTQSGADPARDSGGVRPRETEFHSYFARYIDLVQEGEILPALETQIADVRGLVARAQGKEQFAYADGKWTVRQVMGHVTDTERVFAYRALVFGRRDATELPGFDENAYAANSRAGDIPLADLVEEFALVRGANIRLLAGLPPESWSFAGVANHRSITVRALAFLMAGHVRHHLIGVKERYGI